MESKTLNNLLFRQQFIMGPHYIRDLPAWQQLEITPSVVITAHPDLNINCVGEDNNLLILMGYIIDPRRPHHSNEQILKRLLLENSDLIDLITATYALCGNWILIVKRSDRMSLFHDCTGARSIFYTNIAETRHLWCASQPRLIADVLDLNESENAIDFIWSQRKKSHNHWWPGDTSPYREIKRLLPNNFLDINNGQITRYWPDGEMARMNKNNAIEKISTRLKGIMSAAAKRFDLAIALSAGLDSRVMLAACKDIRNSIVVCNSENSNISSRHPDLVIPKRLASDLNLHFHFIPAPKSRNHSFYKILEMNAPYPTMEIAAMLQAEFDYFNLSKVCVTGNILEIVRCYYHHDRLNPAEHRLNGAVFASHAKMANAPFAIDAFENWLQSIHNLFNIKIPDIYGWEQRHGSWLSNACLIESTCWKEIFFPFNCRNLLMDFLSVSEEHRRSPDFSLFIELAKSMWPEVLSEPINPKPEIGILNKMARKLKTFLPFK